MKKFVTPLLILFGLVSLAGCEDEPFIKANPTSVSFSQEGGTQTINLSTNSISWQAAVSGKGFSVSPSSGSGNATLQLKAAAATSSSDATGTLTIKSGTMQASVSITQSAKNTLIVKGTNTVEHDGGTYTLTLEHNTTYTVTVDEQAKSWIQFTGTRAMSTATLEFLIAANPGAPRSGAVQVSDPAGIAQTQTFVFEQKESPARAALMELYNTLGGANWDASKTTHWNTNEPVGTWGGISTEDGKITKLNVNAFGLQGTLPAVFGSLTTLKELDLGDNPHLQGTWPKEIGDMKNLERFRAAHTELEGPLPKEWAGATSLAHIDLSHTHLEGPLPTGFLNNLKHLAVLKLNDNPGLGGRLPKELGSLETDAPQLQLHLHNCNFQEGIPEEWDSLTEACDQLLLYGNKLTEPVPLFIQSHTSWTEDKWDVWVDDTTHGIRTQQDGVFLELEQVPDAQRDCLMALYNNLDGENWEKGKNWGTDIDIDAWEGVSVADSAIVALNLNGFGLNGELPSCIGHLKSLKTIDFSNNPQLTGALPAQLEYLSNLTHLKASFTGLTGQLPARLSNLKKLVELQLDNTQIEGPLPDALFEELKNLQVLRLNNNPHLTGALPEALGNLTTTADKIDIYLHECNFTGGIPPSWSHLPETVDRLSIYGNKLTKTIPAALIEHPNWELWDVYKENTNIHYIRSQQDNVFLDVENVLPTVGEITIGKLTHNEIIASAAVERQGSHPVTERGMLLNTTKRRQGSGVGSFSITFTYLDENTTYTLQAYATSQAGTAYGPEITVTTPIYNELLLTLTDENMQPLSYGRIYLKRVPEESVPAQGMQHTIRAQSASTHTTKSVRPAQALHKAAPEHALQAAADRMKKELQPYRTQVKQNLRKLHSGAVGTKPYTRSMQAAASQTEDPDYSVYISDGQALFENIETGTYGVRITDVFGLVDNFYTFVTVQHGKNTTTIEAIPNLSITSSTLSLFRPNAGIRPFASPVADDNIVALVSMHNDYVRQYKGKIVENILLCPTDTTASILIVANSEDQLEEIFEAFLAMSEYVPEPEEELVSTKSEDITEFFNFIENLAKHVVMIGDIIPGRTNLVLQSEYNLKRIMIEGMKQEGQWETLKGAASLLGITLTEGYVIKLEDNHSLLLNLILKQQGPHPVLMTDGNGPPVEGSNWLILESNPEVTSIQDLGYNGNWHLGVTVK